MIPIQGTAFSAVKRKKQDMHIMGVPWWLSGNSHNVLYIMRLIKTVIFFPASLFWFCFCFCFFSCWHLNFQLLAYRESIIFIVLSHWGYGSLLQQILETDTVLFPSWGVCVSSILFNLHIIFPLENYGS